MKARLNKELKYLLNDFYESENKDDTFLQLAAYSEELLSSNIFWRNACIVSWIFLIFILFLL